MTIGFCRLDLYLPECTSLKQKRSVIKSITTRTRNKFNVSVSELGDNDRWQSAQLGVATVANDSRYANQILSKVVDLIEREDRLIVVDYSLELL